MSQSITPELLDLISRFSDEDIKNARKQLDAVDNEIKRLRELGLLERVVRRGAQELKLKFASGATSSATAAPAVKSGRGKKKGQTSKVRFANPKNPSETWAGVGAKPARWVTAVISGMQAKGMAPEKILKSFCQTHGVSDEDKNPANAPKALKSLIGIY